MTPEALGKWVGLAAVAWNALTALINWIFWFKTPEEWLAFAEQRPRAASLLRVVRSYGVDPRKGLLALRDLAAAHAARGGPPPQFPPTPPPAGGSSP